MSDRLISGVYKPLKQLRTQIESFTLYYFDNGAFDMWFLSVAGAAPHDGSASGEMFRAVSQIDDGDVDSWVKEWTEMGDRLEILARTSLADDHLISARKSFLRASTYYRTAVQFVSPLQSPSRYRDTLEQARLCFKEGAALLDPPIERLEIPFDDGEFPGYFLPAEGEGPHPTIIVIGGGDSFVEDLYFFTGSEAHDREYNAVLVGLPGQGGTPLDGFLMRPDAEVPIGAVLDLVLDRPEVDPERIAVEGCSLGGYFVPRAAADDDRIGVCIANGLILDFHEYLTDWPHFRIFKKIEQTILLSIIQRVLAKRVNPELTKLDSYKWRWGIDSVAEWIDVSTEYRFDPAEISCPTLLLIGQEEYDSVECFQRFHDRALAEISHEMVELHVMPTALGAGGHIGIGNLTYKNQVLFDWLDETFEVVA